jgi:hypothetical protein
VGEGSQISDPVTDAEHGGDFFVGLMKAFSVTFGPVIIKQFLTIRDCFAVRICRSAFVQLVDVHRCQRRIVHAHPALC